MAWVSVLHLVAFPDETCESTTWGDFEMVNWKIKPEHSEQSMLLSSLKALFEPLTITNLLGPRCTNFLNMARWNYDSEYTTALTGKGMYSRTNNVEAISTTLLTVHGIITHR